MTRVRTRVGFALFVAIAVASLSFCGSGLSPALAATTLTISGTITNGTPGGAVPGQLTVTVSGLDTNKNVTFQRQGTATGGHYQLADVPASADSYVVSTTYAGVEYDSAPITPNGAATATADFKIYETTDNGSQIHVKSLDWVLASYDPSTSQAEILEMMTVTNGGDRAFIGTLNGDPGSNDPGVRRRTLRFNLPASATDLSLAAGLDQGDMLATTDGFASTRPVPPGDQQIVYSYTVSYSMNVIEVTKTLNYQTDLIRFLSPDANLDFRSDKLQDAGTQTLMGQSYRVLAAQNLTPNTSITVDIIGLPSALPGGIDQSLVQVAGGLLAVSGLILALALGLRARPARAADDPAIERLALLRRIANLDERFAAGQVPVEAYQAERSAAKQQLMNLILADGSLTGTRPEPEVEKPEPALPHKALGN